MKKKTILRAYDEISRIKGDFQIQLFNLKVLERLINDEMPFTSEELSIGEYAIFVEKQLEATVKEFEEKIEYLYEAYIEMRSQE